MKKKLEASEWMFIIKSLQAISITGKDARGFVNILDKVEHQCQLSIERENKEAQGKE
tara:strand:- start:21561 stop:21731 length:171 start_codon:yes stop_codon:yes gene_type:complete